jgi:hypothetical protein
MPGLIPLRGKPRGTGLARVAVSSLVPVQNLVRSCRPDYNTLRSVS